MKKVFCVLLALLLLCGCGGRRSEKAKKQTKTVGVWISCYELNSMLDSGEFKERFTLAAKRISDFGVTDAFVHVRGFSDSLFESEYYSLNPRASQYGFDLLEFMISTLHKKGVRFHAWINPFRTADGGSENPADIKVRAGVLGGVKEILRKYDVAGIHFDDYFYPADNDGIDAAQYAAYCAAAQNPLSKAEWRRENINALILEVRDAVKSKGEDTVFSISPSAGITKNADLFFADVEYWCAAGAADMIIPQLYFGFNYPDENFRFDKLLKEWKALNRKEGVRLCAGLAAYKLGTENGPDAAEWQTGADILARQTEICLEDGEISGVCYFSYTYLFADDELHNKAREEIGRKMSDYFP